MKKIATHNSATGEKPSGLFSWLMIPFCRTQSKTIRQQYDAGCRLFDIRVRYDGGTLRCAHGLFTTARTAHDILHEINRLPEVCRVSVTYEGVLPYHMREYFIDQMLNWRRLFPCVMWGDIAVKYKDYDLKTDWEVLIPADVQVPSEQGFLPLDGSSWHTYLPIPWLWKKLYFNKPAFNDSRYLFVDFL